MNNSKSGLRFNMWIAVSVLAVGCIIVLELLKSGVNAAVLGCLAMIAGVVAVVAGILTG